MTDNDLYWFEAEGSKDLGEQLANEITTAISDNEPRQRDLFTFLRLYSSKAARGLTVRDYFLTKPGSINSKQGCNLVRRITDFARNKIGKSYPSVQCLPSGTSEWIDQQKCKEATKLIEGVFEQSKLYKKALVSLTHCILLGVGITQVLEEDDRIKYEWVFPSELIIPLSEQMYDDPKVLFRTKQIDRGVLSRKFPKKKSEIKRLDRLLEVWEAWKLPSSPDAKDGRHVIMTKDNSIVLLDEKWTSTEFPFAFLKYSPEPLGTWPAGLGEILLPYQYDLNLTLRSIQQNIQAGSNLKILVENGSTPAQHITDEIGAIISYNPGTRPPAWLNTPSVSRDLTDRLVWTLNQSWEEAGFSQTANSEQRPAGLNSGVALRTYTDLQSERQAVFSKAWEEYFKVLGQLTLQAAQRIYERTGKFVASWPGRSRAQFASMEKAMLDTSLYEIKCFSTGRLPDTPAGRLEFVNELVAGGIISDKAAILRLLEFPDLEAELDQVTASIDVIDARIDEILQGGELRPPHERMDLIQARDRANLAYCRAENDGAPPEVLERLGEFADMAQQLLDVAAQSQQPQPAPQEAQPTQDLTAPAA